MADTNKILQDEWLGCYKAGWKGLICDASFAHPAKYAHNLIERIYSHVIAENWISAGGRVVDPFGGVALGGLDAMRHGLHWTGCELEEKFVGLGNQNIALWNERYSRMPNWGTAVLVQGDSRQLSSVLDKARLIVSSPPYAGDSGKRDRTGDERARRRADEKGFKQGLGCFKTSESYGDSEGQLGAMKEGDLQVTLAKSRNRGGPNSVLNRDQKYGNDPGQLGAMVPGDHALAITSPPYNPPMSQDHNGSRGGQRGTTPSEKGAFVKYGNTPGQLEGMSMDGFDVAISSPPFSEPQTRDRAPVQDGSVSDFMNRAYTVDRQGTSEGNVAALPQSDESFQAAISSPPFESIEGAHSSRKFKDPEGLAERRAEGYRSGRLKGHFASKQAILRSMEKANDATYGDDANNLGNQRGEDFWSASRLILEQLYQVITPGGHAVFVTKRFVRNKAIVDFTQQWILLCEAVGFRLLHQHRALLTEEYGSQHTLDGGVDTKTVQRKSFFRRLAENHGSPRIDWEDVTCFLRPE